MGCDLGRVLRLAGLAAALLSSLATSPSAAGGYRTNLWPGGEIPIITDPSLTAAQDQIVADATFQWSQAANLNFRPVEVGDLAWVLVRDSSGDLNPANYVGSIGLDGIGHGLGDRKVNIASWTVFTVVHELGHILGLVHEQNRLGREMSVQVETDNAEFGLFNFNFLVDLTAEVYGDYDFDSLMHYRACAFSVCGGACESDDPDCRTITVHPPNDIVWQDAIGQRDHVSDVDELLMSFLYPESDWRFVDDDDGTLFPSGTFLDPWSTIGDGASLTPSGGSLWIQPGVYGESLTFDRPMTIRAPLGGVTIGQ